jgi:hypothetical protein
LGSIPGASFIVSNDLSNNLDAGAFAVANWAALDQSPAAGSFKHHLEQQDVVVHRLDGQTTPHFCAGCSVDQFFSSVQRDFPPRA